MELGPEVILSIEKSKRKMARAKASIAVMFFIIIASLASVLVSLIVRIALASGDNVKSFFSASAPILLMLSAVPIAFYGYRIWKDLRKDRWSYRYVLAQRVHLRAPQQTMELGRFRSALDGVSIGLGLPSPHLEVLDIPGPNAVSFIDERRRACVGITLSLLNMDLSGYEMEAILAHQLSHILTSNLLKPPKFLDVKRTALVAQGLAISLWFALFQVRGGIGLIIGCLILTAAILLPVILLPRLDNYYYEDDILADSIASRVTGGANLLQSLIANASSAYQAMVQRGTCPPTKSSCRHFIMPPDPGEWSSSWVLIDRGKAPLSRSVMERSLALTSERLNNLEVIQQGHWPAFASQD